MKNQLVVKEVEFKPGIIKFDGYQQLKQSATKLADHVKTVEVTDKNIQQSKKLRAAVNNQLKALNADRKAIKKQMMEPYDQFESQIREIEDIVNSANDQINIQIRQQEEKERNEKAMKVKKLFDRHKKQFKDFPLNGDDFLDDQPQELNKSVSMTKVEADLVNWIQARQSDITAIAALGVGDEVLANYFSNGYRVSDAVNEWKHDQRLIQEAHERMKLAQSDSKPEPQPEPEKEPTYTFTVVGEESAAKVRKLLESNHIEFTQN